jgi:NAD(P)-dependent dehydrogenase (short-subunit alcohol dehydrogenase family)
MWNPEGPPRIAAPDDERPLQDKVAIVTGGSSGIGRSACVAFARAGAGVLAVGRSAARLNETLAEARRAGGDASRLMSLTLDVSNEMDMARMAERALERFGRIDILLASAGILRNGKGPKTATELDLDDWNAILRTNLRGTFLSNRAVLPAMLRQRSGDIINVSSTSGLRGFAYDAAYCASKFGIIGLSESLAEEVRRQGVRVMTLCPGPASTAMWDQNLPVPPPEKTMPVERVTELLMYIVTLPRDTVLHNPVIVPLRSHRRPAFRAPGPGSAVGRGEEPALMSRDRSPRGGSK